MKFAKRNASAIVSIVIFILGVVTKLFKKNPPANADMILTVDHDQITAMLEDGGSVIFKDVYVNGTVSVQLKRD